MLLVLVVLTAWKGSQLFQYDGTYEYEGSFIPDEETFIEKSSIKFVFVLWDLVTTFEFDSTKVDAYIDHRFFNYTPEGNLTVTETRYDIRPCTASDFNRT